MAGGVGAPGKLSHSGRMDCGRPSADLQSAATKPGDHEWGKVEGAMYLAQGPSVESG